MRHCKAQASFEYIVLVALFILVLAVVLVFATNKVFTYLKDNEVGDSAKSITRAVNHIAALGPGTTKVIQVKVPDNVAQGYASGKEVIYRISYNDLLSDLHYPAKANVYGLLEPNRGNRFIVLKVEDNGYVSINPLSDPNLTDEIMLYLNFEHRNSSHLIDLTGRDNHGRIMNSLSCGDEGYIGRACDFDGTDDYSGIYHDSSLQPVDGVTVAAWIKTSTAGIIATKTNPKFTDGFESGGFSKQWTVVGSSTNRSRVVDSTPCNPDPNDGTYYAFLDSGTGGTFANNTIKTNYDFSGARNIILNFSTVHTAETLSACSDHSGDLAACDGAFFTCDGVDWKKIWQGPQGSSLTWYDININISANASFCSEVNSSFAVKFTQYSDQGCDLEGIGFDDINISFEADIPYMLSSVNGGEFKIKNNSVEYNVTYAGNINNNIWHHIAATYNGSEIRLYIDGELEQSSTAFSGDLPLNYFNLTVGRNYTTYFSSNHFDGYIDELMIWNRSLTTGEISALYILGKGPE